VHDDARGAGRLHSMCRLSNPKLNVTVATPRFISPNVGPILILILMTSGCVGRWAKWVSSMQYTVFVVTPNLSRHWCFTIMSM